MLQNQSELALVVIAPSLVANNDFVFVMEDFHRSKFGICAVKKKRLGGESLSALFKDLVPRVHSLEVLDSEFKRGDAVLLVVEKAKAIAEAEELIGKFGIKVRSDFEKKKVKGKPGQLMPSFGLGAAATTLVQEYGSFVFCFPNAALNQEKILREFRELPGSKKFKLERVK